MATRQKVLQSAEKLVSKGKLEAAIKEYRKILKKTPGDTNTLNRVGDLYARMDRVGEAVDLFRRTATAYTEDGFFVKAIAIYKKIIRLDPSRIEVYEDLADLYHKQGLINEARTQYQAVVEYHERHRDRDAVLRTYGKMADLEPSNPTHRVKLAELYKQEGKVEEALAEYRRISETMREHGHLDEAVQVLVSALDIQPNNIDFVTDCALALKKEGHLEAARNFVEQASERNPQVRTVAQLAGLVEAPESPAEEAPAPAVEEPVAPAEPPVEPADEDEEAEPAAIETAEAPGEDEVEIELEPPPAERAAEPETEEIEIEVEDTDTDLRVTLLVEAETLLKYGMEAKAGERLQEVLELDPDNLMALGRLLELSMKQGDREQVGPLAQRIAQLFEQRGDSDSWDLIEEKLLASGYLLDVERGRVLRGPGDAVVEEEPLAEPVPAQPEPEVEIEEEVIEKPAEPQFELVEEPVEEEEELVAEPEPEVEVVAEAEEEPVEVELAVDEVFEEATGAQAQREETSAGLAWLEAASPSAPSGTAVGAQADGDVAAEELFSAEEDFFDLAAELEDELAQDELTNAGVSTASEVMEAEAQTLEEIVEGFKKGVSDNLSSEDYDTHYNLGIAYREMGLLDEAIGEFQLAAKSPVYLVECASMLASSFLEKGFPKLAEKWYRRGLDAPDISEEAQLGFMYSLGDMYLAGENRDAARETFSEIYGLNSNYRDVIAKLEELGTD